MAVRRASIPSRRGGPAFDRAVVNEFVFNRRLRFVYCPIPKVASTTFKMLLHQLEGVAVEEVAGADHSRLGALHDARRNRLNYLFELPDGEVAEMLGGDWFRFVFVRNPWTRFLSAYRNKIEPYPQRLQMPEYRHNPDRIWVGEVVAAVREAFAVPAGRHITFAEFAGYTARQDPGTFNPHYRPQTLLSGWGRIDYDFVGKLEALEADYARLADRLGIDLPLPLNRRPFSGATERVADYYDDETARLVGDLYAQDATCFDYRFPAGQVPG